MINCEGDHFIIGGIKYSKANLANNATKVAIGAALAAEAYIWYPEISDTVDILNDRYGQFDPMLAESLVNEGENYFYGKYFDTESLEPTDDPTVYQGSFWASDTDITVPDFKKGYYNEEDRWFYHEEAQALTVTDGTIPFFRKPLIGEVELFTLTGGIDPENVDNTIQTGNDIHFTTVLGQPFAAYDHEQKYDPDRFPYPAPLWPVVYHYADPERRFDVTVYTTTYYQLLTEDGLPADPNGNALPEGTAPYYTLPIFVGPAS